MRREYRLSILVEAHDRASSILGRVGTALGRLGEIAGGILLAGSLLAVTDRLKRLAAGAIESAGAMQQYRVALETLITKELLQGQEVVKIVQTRLSLTEEERLKLRRLIAQRDVLVARLQEEAERHRQLVARWGEEGLAVKTHAARMRELQVELDALQSRIDALQAKEGQIVQTFEKVRVGGLSLDEALSRAPERVKELMNQLRDLALVSPYEYQMVLQTFRLQMAFGATSDLALDLTRALLDLAAGLGLGSHELHRLVYNFAQLLSAGKITALDLRQLRWVGLDLADVFREELAMSVEEVNDALAQGKLTMRDVSEALARYAEKYFGGAARRLAKTWFGLQSSIRDVFFFVGADLLTPAIERVSEILGDLIQKARGFLASGTLEKIGERLGDFVGRALEGLIGLVERVGRTLGGLVRTFEEAREKGESTLGALKEALLSLVPPELSGLVGQGLGLLQGALEWLLGHRDALVGALKGLGAALGAAGLVAALGALGAAVAALVNPVTWLIGAVGLLGAAWEEDWGGIREEVSSFWDRVQPVLENLRAWLGEKVPQALAAVRTWWEESARPVLQAAAVIASKVFGAMAEVLGEKVGPALQKVKAAVEKHLGPLKARFQELWQSLKPILGGLGVLLVGAAGLVTGALSGILEALGPFVDTVLTLLEDLMGALSGALDIVTGIFGLLVGIFRDDEGQVSAALETLKEGVTKLLGNLLQGVVDLVAGAWETLKALVRGMVDGIIRFVESLVERLVGHSLIPDLVNRIVEAFVELKERVLTVFQPFVEALQNLVKWVLDRVTPALSTLKAWVAENLPKALEALESGWEKTGRPVFEAVWRWVSEKALPVLEALGVWFLEKLPEAVGAAASVLQESLLPLWREVWEFLEGRVLPVFRQVSSWLREQLPSAVGAARGAWDSLKSVVELVRGALEQVWSWTGKVGNKLDWLRSHILGPLKGALDDVKDALQWVVDKLQSFYNWLSRIKIPDWLEGHSPPPLAEWFQDIAQAVQTVRTGLEGLQWPQGAVQAASPVPGEAVYNISVTIQDPASADLFLRWLEGRDQIYFDALMGEDSTWRQF